MAVWSVWLISTDFVLAIIGDNAVIGEIRIAQQRVIVIPLLAHKMSKLSNNN